VVLGALTVLWHLTSNNQRFQVVVITYGAEPHLRRLAAENAVTKQLADLVLANIKNKLTVDLAAELIDDLKQTTTDMIAIKNTTYLDNLAASSDHARDVIVNANAIKVLLDRMAPKNSLQVRTGAMSVIKTLCELGSHDIKVACSFIVPALPDLMLPDMPANVRDSASAIMCIYLNIIRPWNKKVLNCFYVPGFYFANDT
jgi:hypothetical protein